MENIQAFRQVLTRWPRAQDCARHTARSQVQQHVRKGDEAASRASSTRIEQRVRRKAPVCLRQRTGTGIAGPDAAAQIFERGSEISRTLKDGCSDLGRAPNPDRDWHGRPVIQRVRDRWYQSGAGIGPELLKTRAV